MTRERELERVVRELATPAGRMVGTAGHAAARDFLLAEIEWAGLSGYDESGAALRYECMGQEFTNVVASLPGGAPGLDPVLLAAHYDTCGPYPGADDNAAGIAILLSLVGPLRRVGLPRPVVLAFFDSEEPPYCFTPAMGSTWFYEQQRRGAVHCAMVLDLVGHDVPVAGWEDLLFVTGIESDPGLEQIYRAVDGKVDGIRTLPTLTRYIGDMSDYRPFRLDRRPYLFLSCAQWPHYHMPTDTPEKLNYRKMVAVADYLLEVTRAAATTQLDGPFEEHDTTATEVAAFRAVGVPVLAKRGMVPRTRTDLDILVPQLARMLLQSAC